LVKILNFSKNSFFHDKKSKNKNRRPLKVVESSVLNLKKGVPLFEAK
jgi:hypothetical protein